MVLAVLRILVLLRDLTGDVKLTGEGIEGCGADADEEGCVYSGGGCGAGG